MPTAAFAAAPSLHPDRAAGTIDAVPMTTVLDASGPTVDVKVTNSTGKEVTLRGWLNDAPATAAVPVRSEIVKLAFPAMTEGQATLKLSLTAEGIADVAEHKVLVAQSTTKPAVDPAAAPDPNGSKAPKPKPSWSKSPKPSMSPTHSPTHSPTPSPSELPKTGDSVSSYVALGGGSLLLGMVVIGLAWAMGRRTSRVAR